MVPASQVMRIPLPSDLDEEEIWDAANDTIESLAEAFVVLPNDETAGYLEMDLRPDKRYLYLTVPGNDSEPDGRVRGSAIAIGAKAVDAWESELRSQRPSWVLGRPSV